MIIVATALIGETESLPAAPRYPGGEFVAYSDRPCDGWRVVVPPEGYARQAARRAKMAVLDDFPGAQWSIWLDASFDLLVDPVELVAAAIATGCDVAAFRHPDRSRICDEAREVIRLGLAPKDCVERQIEAYRLAGFDTEAGPQRALTTTGLLVRRHTPAVRYFTARWREEIELHTLRDQLSVDYAAWRAGMTIGYLPGHYRDNRFARYQRVRHRVGRVAA